MSLPETVFSPAPVAPPLPAPDMMLRLSHEHRADMTDSSSGVSKSPDTSIQGDTYPREPRRKSYGDALVDMSGVMSELKRKQTERLNRSSSPVPLDESP